MRAVMSETYGAMPELREIPEPTPGEGEAKIRVRASSVNGFDAKLAGGFLKGMMEHQFPVVLGKDFAGTVTEVGPGVTSLMSGEEVFGVVMKPTLGDGAFGDFVVVPAGVGVAPMIAGLDYATAGLLGLAGTTAVMAVDAIGPQRRETVLIAGATGGVGGYAVQFAAQRGAVVIATAPPGPAADQLHELGATYTVDHHGDLVGQVRALAPIGVDAVLHLAGDPSMLAGLLTADGRFASTLGIESVHSGTRQVPVTAVNAMPDRDTLDRLAVAVTSGRLRTLVTRSYPLDEVPQAIEDFNQGGKLGKLAVAVA